MDLDGDSKGKYGIRDVLASSAPLGWRGMAAQLRHHRMGELPPFRPTHLEIGIAVGCHPASVVTRKGDGRRQRTRVEPGVVWLCPAGVLEEDIRISAWHDVLHLYLPAEQFTLHAEQQGGLAIGPESVRYLGGLHDDLIRRVGQSLLAEMRAPSSAGPMRVEGAALALTERLVACYAAGASRPGSPRPRHRLDERRLGRVLDYMNEHLDEPVGLETLASVACLSAFHFNRMFAQRMGVPPHRYLGMLRLERAKALLAGGDMPLADIAWACCFTSQSNFSRAFRRATGTSPRRYRRAAR